MDFQRLLTPISNLGIDFTTLEALIDHPKKETILEKTPWSLYLPKMTDDELKQFFELLNTRLFQKIFSNSIIDSFIEGILEVFPKWYQVACSKWLNKLISITDVIYFAKRIDRQIDKQLFINKISQELLDQRDFDSRTKAHTEWKINETGDYAVGFKETKHYNYEAWVIITLWYWVGERTTIVDISESETTPISDSTNAAASSLVILALMGILVKRKIS